VFVRRGPLPREKPRGISLTGRFPKSMCYRPEDLRIGAVINVHGRGFFLYDCDAATREWYTVRAAWVGCDCIERTVACLPPLKEGYCTAPIY